MLPVPAVPASRQVSYATATYSPYSTAYWAIDYFTPLGGGAGGGKGEYSPSNWQSKGQAVSALAPVVELRAPVVEE